MSNHLWFEDPSALAFLTAMIRFIVGFRFIRCFKEETDMRYALALPLMLFVIFSNAQAGSLEILPPGGNWNKVQALPPNTEIEIEISNGERISGNFLRLTDDSILFEEFGREKACLKDAVVRVSLIRPGSRARNAAIAAGISFGAGFGLGYAAAARAADQDRMSAGQRAGIGAAVGALSAGAASLVFLARTPSPQKEVIYRHR
jgi:hypothetical protein